MLFRIPMYRFASVALETANPCARRSQPRFKTRSEEVVKPPKVPVDFALQSHLQCTAL